VPLTASTVAPDPQRARDSPAFEFEFRTRTEHDAATAHGGTLISNYQRAAEVDGPAAQ
jgi:hypothetical protein